jgi:hypothetical protein
MDATLEKYGATDKWGNFDASTALSSNFFIETFLARGSSGFAYENIATTEIKFPDCHRFIVGKRLCGSRASGLSAAAASGHGG